MIDFSEFTTRMGVRPAPGAGRGLPTLPTLPTLAERRERRERTALQVQREMLRTLGRQELLLARMEGLLARALDAFQSAGGVP